MEKSPRAFRRIPRGRTSLVLRDRDRVESWRSTSELQNDFRSAMSRFEMCAARRPRCYARLAPGQARSGLGQFLGGKSWDDARGRRRAVCCWARRRARGRHARAASTRGDDALSRSSKRTSKTLCGAVDDGALKLALPPFVRKGLDGYLDCGLLSRGLARLRCDACPATRLVAFSCKGRGCCPSCLGRKMSATASNFVDYVLPKVVCGSGG